MKKLINTSFIYLILALAAGVFYREFTKFNGFIGDTTLSVLHTHLLILGKFFFLVYALFTKAYPQLSDSLKTKKFYIGYNVSVFFFTVTLLVRGIVQVLNVELSSGANAAISGIAGISHILLTISLVYFFTILKKVVKD